MDREMFGQVFAVEKFLKAFVYKLSISSCFRSDGFKPLENSNLLEPSAATLEVFNGGVGVWHCWLLI